MTSIEQDLQQALRHFHLGQLEQADALCVKVLRAAPGHAEASNLLAAVAVQMGRPDVAAELLSQAIASDGKVREYHHNLGNILRQLGQPDQAELCYRRALALAPFAVDSLYELATTLADAGRREAAAPLLRALVTAVPDVADGHYRLGILLLQGGANRAAIACFRRALRCNPELAEAHTNLAVMLREEGDFAGAERDFAVSVLLRPDDADALLNLGTFYRESGRRDQFGACLERAIAVRPEQADLHYTLAMGRGFKPGDRRLPGLAALERRLPALDRPSRIKALFAIAKAHEDLDEPDQAFRRQMEANRLKRAETAYDENAALGHFQRIMTVFTKERIDAIRAGLPATERSDLPIFVLGMPRSGSSLIEQILASHAAVFGAGELLDLPLLARALGPDSGPFFPEYVAGMQPAEFVRLGADYLAGLRARAPRAARIVDKLPDNFRLIGLIHLALPQARIIHTRRDPIDSCLSIYSKLFTADIPYSYDLGEIGRYWRTYETVMEHWRRVLPPGSFIEVDYEAMVADQEGETRRLLDYCGLEWDPAVLQFHRTERVVRTASALQVRSPLYSSSVGRWRPEPPLLQPLLDGLQGR